MNEIHFFQWKAQIRERKEHEVGYQATLPKNPQFHKKNRRWDFTVASNNLWQLKLEQTVMQSPSGF